MRRLILFDIDGTLLNGGRLWREVFEGAFAELFPGKEFPGVSFSGKTDRQICAEVLAALGMTASEGAGAYIENLMAGYLRRLAKALKAGRAREVTVLPGVEALLRALSEDSDCALGLLTGNVRQGALLKLGGVELVRYFAGLRFGAFGDDHADRYELPRIAVDRAYQNIGIRFEGKRVVIIGDTPHDVNCGKSIGVRAIAVGTGRAEYRSELLAANPDFFFETLQDTGSVLRAIRHDWP